MKSAGCSAAIGECGGRKRREMGNLMDEGEETWMERYRRRLRCFSWGRMERLLMEGKGLFLRNDFGSLWAMNWERFREFELEYFETFFETCSSFC